jgi:hypothetical protein
MDWTRTGLEAAGFEGFLPIKGLRSADVPDSAGIYVVLRPDESEPEFLDRNPTLPRNGVDPTVTAAELAEAWLDDAEVLYIGRTGRPGGRRTLKRRLTEFRRHGARKTDKHWGGRYIWQLVDEEDLLVAWRVSTGEDAADEKTELLADFRETYGAPPFANHKVPGIRSAAM